MAAEKVPYQVVARKWRPRVFEEIVGQEHVTTILMNAIEAKRIGHAYLFCGSRGVGKTTTARVLARALNCAGGPRKNPCNECPSCVAMLAGSSLDFIEIDGASNRGIDEIRGLREKIGYTPSASRYSIYVIDEVHMLTVQAFNALLKTLEEPPPHVIFIMATTEPGEILDTIISRCQRFDFRRIPPDRIIKKLREVSSGEQFRIDDAALAIIAKKAEGSLRDAESMLDQLVTGSEETVTSETVRSFFGMPKETVFFDITRAILDGKPGDALRILEGIYRDGFDLSEFTDSLIDHLRNLLFVSIDPNIDESAGILKTSVPGLVEQSSGIGQWDIVRLIRILNSAAYVMKHSPAQRLHLELALVEMANLDSTTSIRELVGKLENIERGLAGDGIITRGSGQGAAETIPAKRPERPAAVVNESPAEALLNESREKPEEDKTVKTIVELFDGEIVKKEKR